MSIFSNGEHLALTFSKPLSTCKLNPEITARETFYIIEKSMLSPEMSCKSKQNNNLTLLTFFDSSLNELHGLTCT